MLSELGLFAFQAYRQPAGQGKVHDDGGVGRGQAGYDEIDGEDVDGPQVQVKMGCQAGAGAEEDGMDQVNGIGINRRSPCKISVAASSRPVRVMRFVID